MNLFCYWNGNEKKRRVLSGRQITVTLFVVSKSWCRWFELISPFSHHPSSIVMILIIKNVERSSNSVVVNREWGTFEWVYWEKSNLNSFELLVLCVQPRRTKWFWSEKWEWELSHENEMEKEILYVLPHNTIFFGGVLIQNVLMYILSNHKPPLSTSFFWKEKQKNKRVRHLTDPCNHIIDFVCWVWRDQWAKFCVLLLR